MVTTVVVEQILSRLEAEDIASREEIRNQEMHLLPARKDLFNPKG